MCPHDNDPTKPGRGILKKIGMTFVALVILYLATYGYLTLNGGYVFSQSGLMRWTFGLAVTDMEMWQPKYCWWQNNFRFATGEIGTRGNMPGYVFAPLILLDRAFWHKSRLIDFGN